MEREMRILALWSIVIFTLFSKPAISDVIDVELHYLGPTEGSTWLGIQQGIDEANLQGEFLGQTYTINPISLQELSQLEAVSAVLLSTDAKTALKVANFAAVKGVPVINIDSDADELRAACLGNLLSITASHKMKQDALAQWLSTHPDSRAHPQVWHKSFRKFAASQLNSRYSKTHDGVAMDDNAWAGWAAVKLLSDTVARTQSDDGAIMLNYLKTKLAFDGQKGIGSTFRETGQLTQLVLIIEDDKIVAEAPLRGVKGGLDSLGMTSCK
jgi:hypothetical protein